ncbi:hypothetical protein E2C01_071629 [Portunus trituberculatus]|uniref:Uncharacterized protein n=1 Tax=Portunus trituberculatus TaxID=210409 RepID=A0A5B7I0E7_PORTR|nr:hypothetical protein [Portunus trituberculatus]
MSLYLKPFENSEGEARKCFRTWASRTWLKRDLNLVRMLMMTQPLFTPEGTRFERYNKIQPEKSDRVGRMIHLVLH